MRKLIGLALFCLSTASVAAENAVLETHFKNYAASWGPDADMDAMVASVAYHI